MAPHKIEGRSQASSSTHLPEARKKTNRTDAKVSNLQSKAQIPAKKKPLTEYESIERLRNIFSSVQLNALNFNSNPIITFDLKDIHSKYYDCCVGYCYDRDADVKSVEKVSKLIEGIRSQDPQSKSRNQIATHYYNRIIEQGSHLSGLYLKAMISELEELKSSGTLEQMVYVFSLTENEDIKKAILQNPNYARALCVIEEELGKNFFPKETLLNPPRFNKNEFENSINELLDSIVAKNESESFVRIFIDLILSLVDKVTKAASRVFQIVHNKTVNVGHSAADAAHFIDKAITQNPWTILKSSPSIRNVLYPKKDLSHSVEDTWRKNALKVLNPISLENLANKVRWADEKECGEIAEELSRCFPSEKEILTSGTTPEIIALALELSINNLIHPDGQEKLVKAELAKNEII